MATLSGQKTVAVPGTEVVLGTANVNAPILVKALTTNTGLVYVGNVNGVVTNANGFPLAAGEVVLFYNVSDLETILVDAVVGGEGVAWVALEV